MEWIPGEMTDNFGMISARFEGFYCAVCESGLGKWDKE